MHVYDETRGLLKAHHLRAAWAVGAGARLRERGRRIRCCTTTTFELPGALHDVAKTTTASGLTAKAPKHGGGRARPRAAWWPSTAT